MLNHKMFNAGIQYVSDMIIEHRWATLNEMVIKFECNLNFLELITYDQGGLKKLVFEYFRFLLGDDHNLNHSSV